MGNFGKTCLPLAATYEADLAQDRPASWNALAKLRHAVSFLARASTTPMKLALGVLAAGRRQPHGDTTAI